MAVLGVPPTDDDDGERAVDRSPPAAQSRPAAPAPAARSSAPVPSVDGLVLSIQNSRSETALQAIIKSTANIRLYEASSKADQERIADEIALKRAEWAPPKANGRTALPDDDHIPF
jgi:hypothetical protein